VWTPKTSQRRAVVTKSGKDGSFTLAGLEPGSYELRADLDAQRVVASTPPRVVIVGRETHAGIDVELDSSAAIAGRVVDADGAPVAGVTVRYRALGKNDVCTVSSSEDGRFECAFLAGGTSYAPAV